MEAIIAALGLVPHPEGGMYREVFRDAARSPGAGRSASTAIYFLLRAGEVSRWHRVDAAEVWHRYAGAPLLLEMAPDRTSAPAHDPGPGGFPSAPAHDPGRVTRAVLGMDLARGERPQIVVPAGVWQAARSLGAWTLAGCTVAPGFEFAGFVMEAEPAEREG